MGDLRTGVVGGLALLLVLPTACISEFQGPPPRTPEIMGTITKLEQGDAGAVRILIEERPGVPWDDPEVAGDKMWVTVTDQTRIFVRHGDSSWERGGIGDLEVGLIVRAWPADVADSYPALGSGGDIEVMGSSR